MKNLMLTGKISAAISFIIGTLLLSVFMYFESDFLLILGFYYTLIAAIYNTILFVIIITAALINETFRKELMITSGLVILNLPVAIGYIYIVFP